MKMTILEYNSNYIVKEIFLEVVVLSQYQTAQTQQVHF